MNPVIIASIQPSLREKPPVSLKKLHKRLRQNVGRAIEDYHMIQHGDRVMVCLSGGKDSYTLLDLLLQLQTKAPVDFELIAVNLDQKQPGFPQHILPDYLRSLGIAFDVIERDTYSVVKRIIDEGKTMCSLCSRLRRGTLFLNMFNQGSLKAMPPILRSDDGKNIVIRPLAYCAEADIARYAKWKSFPIIPCNLCGSQQHLQRKKIKQMLQGWADYPGRIESIFKSITNVSPSQLGDKTLFNFDQFADYTPSNDTDNTAWAFTKD